MSQDPAFEAFMKIHSAMPRQGPGELADVGWAARIAGLGASGTVADLGCGPGADLIALSALVPRGTVMGVDAMPSLVAEARAVAKTLDNTHVVQGDMLVPPNAPFDLIWSAGAVYNVGLEVALEAWRPCLKAGGAVAFSHLCWRVPEDARPEAAVAFWAEGYPEMTDEEGVKAQIAAAGWQVKDSHFLSDAAWEAYYTPLEARLAAEEPDADDVMREIIGIEREEIATWRENRESFGYLLSVVVPG